MNSVNESQIQSTNDASTVSKCSAVNRGYFKDDFIQEFAAKKKSRASLIHLGYYTRAVIINKLITKYIAFLNLQSIKKFQIVSLGAGFDTAYWRLSEANLLSNSVFVEIDFPNVIQRKIALIKLSQKLRSHVLEQKSWVSFNGLNKLNFNYYLLEADLSDLTLTEKLLDEIKIDCDIPTLFLSECVITYMKETDSRKLINWICMRFRNGGFINYEQIHPDDGFGQVMLRHFDKLQSSLLSVSRYPDCWSHYIRFNNHGFEKSICLSEWDALIWLIPEEERTAVLSLELFDEFEEFHLKCVHYIVAIAGNGVSSDWINLISPTVTNPLSNSVSRPCLESVSLPCELEVFRHFSCNANGKTLLFGGCSRQSRSSKIYKISHKNYLDVKPVKTSERGSVSFEIVYGTAAYFGLNKKSFVCLYGGRTSPNRVWNNGSPAVCEIVDDEILERLIIQEGNPTGRCRSPMVSLKSSESEADCWVFGGRSIGLNETLSDFWKLSIKCDDKNNLTAKWTQLTKESESWPPGRMSHGFIACPKRSELFIIGGFSMDSSSVLNDMWKWNCTSESWERVQLAGRLLPRYGHSSHVKDDTIYLVGGVNTLAGVQPVLARIDLTNLTVTEYEISYPTPEIMLLFNHTSEIIGEHEDAQICVIGGGGNCFSFGTELNRSALCIRLNQIN